MKTSIIIIDAILVATILVPYYLFIRAGRQAGKRNRNVVKRILKPHQLQPVITEYWNDRYIGIDTQKHVLIFIQFTGEQPEIHLHRLKDLRACEIVIQRTRNGNSRKTPESLSFLGLHLHFRNLAYENKTLPFYDARDQHGEDFEMARAEKWLKRIKEQMPTLQAAESAA